MGTRAAALTLVLLVSVGCRSARPSDRALARIPAGDVPASSTAQIPQDALVRIEFERPSPITAFNGVGESVSFPATPRVIGRVAQRRGDTLWTVVSQTVATDGRTENIPARGPRARIIPVALDGPPPAPTVHVLNANPGRSETLATSGVISIFVLIVLFYLYLGAGQAGG